MALIEALRKEGFTYVTGRTAIAATVMRSLLTKLGSQELPVHDALYLERTYWLEAVLKPIMPVDSIADESC